MTTLRHQIQDERVLIVAACERPVSLHVSPREARRFAWALLADLDPEEAEAAGYVPPEPVQRRRASAADGHTAPGPWQLNEILRLLKDQGGLTVVQVADRIGVAKAHAAVQLSRLKRRGYVKQDGRGRAHYPANYSLTDPNRWTLGEAAILAPEVRK